MTKILITGGAGFIGSHIVDILIEKGHKVIIIDDLSTGKEEHLNKKAKFYKADITNDISSIFKKEKPDIVIHTAAQVQLRSSLENPIFDAKLNILGTINILEECRKNKVKKIIYTSTGGARVGEPEYLPVDEKHPLNPCSPYGISKHTAEHYVWMYNQLYGIDYLIFCFGNVYGPRDDPASQRLVSLFIDKMVKNQKPVIFGDGEQTRDFCITGDTLILMENSTLKKVKNIKVGDKLISFDEIPKNKKRFFHINKVEVISSYISEEVYELKTTKGKINCTGNHPWLMDKRGFRTTKQILLNLKKGIKNQKIRQFTCYKNNPLEKRDYKKGYIVGTIEGDGYCLFYKYKTGTQYVTGLSVTDKEFRDVFYDFLHNKMIGLNKSSMQPKYKNLKRKYTAKSHYKQDYNFIKELVNIKEFKNKEWCKGYLAGIFDSEGEWTGQQIKLSNKNKNVVRNIRKILKIFNFKWNERKRKDGLFYFNILGNLQEKTRFISLIKPKIKRKNQILNNKEAKGSLAIVKSVKSLKPTRVYNLQIENNPTYIANGHFCHNTYVIDLAKFIVNSINKTPNHKLFHLANGEQVSVNDIVKILKRELKFDKKIKHIKAIKGEVRDIVLDTSLVKKELGWEPEHNIEQGLIETIKYFENRKV